MSSCETVHASAQRGCARDPLQIPIALSFDGEPASRDIAEALRDFALWLTTVGGAFFGVHFVGTSVPEVEAAAHDRMPSAQRASNR
jgi:hypothetical protein